MTGQLRFIFQEYTTGRSDLGMLLIQLRRIEGNITIDDLAALLDDYYDNQE